MPAGLRASHCSAAASVRLCCKEKNNRNIVRFISAPDPRCRVPESSIIRQRVDLNRRSAWGRPGNLREEIPNLLPAEEPARTGRCQLTVLPSRH